MRLLRRNQWPVIVPLYDIRECPACFSLVAGDSGQHNHTAVHQAMERVIYGEPEPADPGGYVVGDDITPRDAEMRLADYDPGKK